MRQGMRAASAVEKVKGKTSFMKKERGIMILP